MATKKVIKKNSLKNGFLVPDNESSTAAKFDKGLSKIKEKREIKEKSWYIFVLSFLSNAKNGCDFLINAKRLDDNNKYLLISVIYNFKHGLEVFVKTFSRYLNEKVDKSDHFHDTKTLLETFKKQLKSKNKKELDSEVDKLEKLIEKYNEIDFLRNYLKESFSIYDQKNTFFKYPEHEAMVIVDYSKLSNQVGRSDMEKIKKDIENVIKISKKFKNILS
ncbi:MAG: hypothetical protein WC608_01730 [Parcubacteria group bacterium]